MCDAHFNAYDIKNVDAEEMRGNRVRQEHVELLAREESFI